MNDHLAEKIAMEGRKSSHTFYRKVDMTTYVARLYLEYARVMSLDRKSLNYVEKVWRWGYWNRVIVIESFVIRHTNVYRMYM